jgi:hypothetical protein
VAVYDRDEIHECVGLSDPRCTSAIVRELTPPAGPADRLKTVLLDRNLETVIETLKACGLRADLPWEKALAKRGGALTVRDRILQNAAAPHERAIRDGLMQRMPSFRYLVHKVTAAVLAAPWLPRG